MIPITMEKVTINGTHRMGLGAYLDNNSKISIYVFVEVFIDVYYHFRCDDGENIHFVLLSSSNRKY